ncbi:hypothetical protein H4R24_005349 [Coemansia sp. RSA 988]|nr:hypothetical protein H4R24_005349 [Coemansia sp. RSA 988]
MSSGQPQESIPLPSFIGVHDESSEMRILYASANIERVLNIHPRYIIGQSSYEFFASGKSQEYHMQTGATTGDDVSIVYTTVLRDDASPVHLRLVHFKCDGVGFNACYVISDSNETNMEEEHAATIADNSTDPMSVNRSVVREFEENNNRRPHTRRNTLGMVRACVVLGALINVDDIDMLGPPVLYASPSFEGIIGEDTCEIQGKPFLSLVATQDLLNAGKFLKRMTESGNITSETLLLQVNPFEDPHAHSDDYDNQGDSEERATNKVRVEIIGAGGNDGAVLLIQLQRLPLYPRYSAVEGNHMEMLSISLEDIISSDPETSDYTHAWRPVMENNL